MSHLSYYNYAGYGERAQKDYYYSQAVRIDNRIEISGQGISFPCSPSFPIQISCASPQLTSPLPFLGGWDPTTEVISASKPDEVDQAFRNVDLALKTAGGKGWDEVYRVRAYLVGVRDEELFGGFLRNMRKWCPNHQPLSTVVGVPGLAFEKMNIEVEVEAQVKG